MLRIKNVSTLSAFGAALAVMGCQGRSSHEAMTADLERDLNLATTVRAPHTGVVSALEQNSNGALSGEQAGLRLAVPTTRRAPAPGRSPATTEVPADPLPVEETTVAAPAPAPSPVAVAAEQPAQEVPQAAATPGIIIASGPSAGTGSDGTGVGVGESGRAEGHGGVGAVVGGIIGAIIRGSTVGADNCEPMRPGRRGTLDRGGIIGEVIGGAGRTVGGVERLPGGLGSARFPRY